MSAPSSSIESTLVENRVFEPTEATRKAARISGMDAYNALCAEAENDFEGFWARLARETLTWSKPFTKTLDESNAPFYTWFEDGELNASYNCLDRHMGTPVENKTAIIFEADGGEVTKVTYKELLAKVSQFANALKARGVKKGDRVVIYMPMTIEGVVAMQACARIGATHSVVFGGFSAKALQERIQNASAVAVITANYQLRGGKELPRSASELTELVGRLPLRDIVRETTDLIEQLCIEAALDLTGDNRASAAEMLGLSRQSLYIKLRRFGIKDTPGDDVAPE